MLVMDLTSACRRRRSSLRTPLKTEATAGPSAEAQDKQPSKEKVDAKTDVESARSCSDSEVVGPRLPSLFHPAARVKSVMDVSPDFVFTVAFVGIGKVASLHKSASRIWLAEQVRDLNNCQMPFVCLDLRAPPLLLATEPLSIVRNSFSRVAFEPVYFISYFLT